DARRMLVLALITAHGIGIVYTLGTGAGVNHLFDAIVSICPIVGLSLPAIEGIAVQVRRCAAFLAVVLIAPFLSTLAVLPQRLPDDGSRFQSRQQAEASFAAAANFVRSQSGDAMCESLLICNVAGKPITWDPFVIGQLVKTGRVDENRILGVLSNRGFAVIEI